MSGELQTSGTEMPPGVSILGIFFILGGILGVVSGLWLAAASLLFLFLVFLGTLMGAAGAGFFLRWGWSWTLAVIILSFSIIAETILVLSGGFRAGLALFIHVVILMYLDKGRVRRYFGTT